MEVFEVVAVIILVMLVGGAVVAFSAAKVSREEYRRIGKHPQGHYMGTGMALGVALGIPIGVALGNIALGPGFGIAIGLAIGSLWEKKHAKELRPLTKKEQEVRKNTLMYLKATFVLGLIVFVMLLLYR